MSTTVGRGVAGGEADEAADGVAGAERPLSAADGPLGLADCEAIGQGLLAQPVAALSSVAFVVVGGWLAWTVRGLPSRPRLGAWVYAALLALVGLGSVAYHGLQVSGAELLHDAPVALLLLLAILVPASRAVRRDRVLRAGSRPWLVVGGMAAAVALVAYPLGRTGSVLCAPESGVQMHAVWHSAAALALGAWGRALWPGPSGARATAGAVRRRQDVGATS